MENRTLSTENRPPDFERRSVLYRIKVELRREERAGRGDSLYAEALRHVLRAFCIHDPETALQELQREMQSFRKRGDEDAERVLRRAVTVVGSEARGVRELFKFYLQRLEADGRGSEPFAEAIRKILTSPRQVSLKELYFWKDRGDSAD